MIQALAKHVEQLVALPDELRETTIRKCNRLCDSCGCHNVRELAARLAEEQRPRVCPLARLLRACGQLQTEIKLPACLSLGVAGRDTSWRALLMHLRQKAAAPEASQELISDVAIVQAWGAIRRRFRRRDVRVPRQLLLGASFALVPANMKKDPAWLQLFRRTLLEVDVRRLFPSLNRSEGARETAVHQALISDVIRGLQQQSVPVGHLVADERWRLVRSSAPRRSFLHTEPEAEAPFAAFMLDQWLHQDEAEGLLGLMFHAQNAADWCDHVPAEVLAQLSTVLQQYQDSVFKDCEFAPFPPARGFDFQIQLEPAAQVPASLDHKLAPALVDKLLDMIKELLHNGLIVPTSLPFAAPILCCSTSLHPA
jgi:hypothetical protein